MSRYPPYALSSLTSLGYFVALQLFSSLIEISFNTSALVYLFLFYSIYFSMCYFVKDKTLTGGAEESRTPDLLLARQAL